MQNLNRVILSGNLVRDPELNSIPGKGTAVLNMTLAVNNRDNDTLFVNCVAFGNRAEAIAKYLKKGSPILIEGSLILNEYDSRATGKTVREFKVTISNFYFLGYSGSKGSDNESIAKGTNYGDATPEKPKPREYNEDEIPI